MNAFHIAHLEHNDLKMCAVDCLVLHDVSQPTIRRQEDGMTPCHKSKIYNELATFRRRRSISSLGSISATMWIVAFKMVAYLRQATLGRVCIACKILLVTAVSVILLSSPIWACSIPVFQYALLRWPADLYEVIVFHQGTLSLIEQTIVDRLQDASSDDGSRANVIVMTVRRQEDKSSIYNELTTDLATSQDEIIRQLWQTQPRSELPWMVVRSPMQSRSSEVLWSGRFTADAVNALLDSPTRKKIARRILDGESAVWVLLESGISQQDETAARLLEDQLKKLEETLEIGGPMEDAARRQEDKSLIYNELATSSLQGNTYVDPDLRVAFSMVRLSRNDPSERMFVQMLLHTEWALEAISKPMAFPIFGRGRVLYALVGDGINEDNIKGACAFLVGWCSCQVKELNPGVDLLMSVNWDDLIDEKLARSVADNLFGYEEVLVIDSSGSTAVSAKNSGNLKRNILIVVSIQILIVAIATCVVLLRKKRRIG